MEVDDYGHTHSLRHKPEYSAKMKYLDSLGLWGDGLLAYTSDSIIEQTWIEIVDEYFNWLNSNRWQKRRFSRRKREIFSQFDPVNGWEAFLNM
ncbi:hypothetical protein EFE32_06850 [Lactococcus lactis subsp. lactis]|jgi:hypothetical protein|nr:hypothetical protein [Lactococcus lactis subsp. lactis]